MSASTRPSIGDVLREIRPGHTVELRIPAGFLDAHPDNSIAVSVVAHVEDARKRLGAETDTPLVASFLQAAARKLNHDLPIKRCYAVLRSLVEAGIITEAGSYRQKYRLGPAFAGFRVTLYRTARAVASAVPGYKSASISRRRRVNRANRPVPWWLTPLGSLDGRPPPGITVARARRMTTLDDLLTPGCDAA